MRGTVVRPMVGEPPRLATMEQRIGFDHYTLSQRGLSALQTLEFAQTHHFDGVQFLEPASIDPRLDTRRPVGISKPGGVVGTVPGDWIAVTQSGSTVPRTGPAARVERARKGTGSSY